MPLFKNTFQEMKDLIEESGFDLVDHYGQYILFGTLIHLTRDRIKPVSNVKGGKLQSTLERLPFVADVFSKHYKFLRNTAKNMFYEAVKKEPISYHIL